ncbi:SdpI family protein [Halorubrum sp. GN11_10-6_MGM]|uniref:SdpI family protein n=1 Tax=Halorubrum sp. GN11_10-6_MGM TaxID=2518112 RepID=UPI0010F618D5|nr:SdpI family protein [Halorubrum sp. GN11_10-6_MGM]TKX76080.1 SdpI family protein [Halorubrum sp. GN11_10-6_MGM]
MPSESRPSTPRLSTRLRFGVAALLVAVGAAASLAVAPELPERMVTRWNGPGEPTGTLPRTLGLWLVPGLAAGLVGLFALLPRIDPLGENIAAFRVHYDRFVVVFTAFLVGLHLAVLAVNLGYAVDVTTIAVAGGAALFYYLGALLPHVEPNWFVGIRTPWTLSDDAVWERTHALGARLFKLSAVIAAIGLLFGEYAVYFLVGPALATAAVTVAYSYVVYRRTTTAEGGGDGSEGTDGDAAIRAER